MVLQEALLSIILLSIVISACSSTGMNTARHNGLMYYFPDNCSQFKYSNSEPDRLHCVHDGKLTGITLYPATQGQISNHRYQQDQKQQSWDDLN
jgi:hypothetical protein